MSDKGGMGVKKVLAAAAICFCVTLALIVGYRMSSEAMAVVIGVICGVLASVPMSGLILLLTQRRRQYEEPSWTSQRYMPPVVVIQGGSPVQRSELPLVQPPMMASAPREFRVIGEEWVASEREWPR